MSVLIKLYFPFVRFKYKSQQAEIRQGRLRSDEYPSDFYDSDRREPSPPLGRYYAREDR